MRVITHRPEPTRHGMHCTCGVFCGTALESWRAHRDDLLILHPGADTLERRMSDMECWSAALRAIGEAYTGILRNGSRAAKSFADALAPDLRRGNAARARQARIDAEITPRVATRLWRPSSHRTWELRGTPSGSALYVSRTDGGKLEIRTGNETIEVSEGFVEAFGEAIADAVAWKDAPDERPTDA